MNFVIGLVGAVVGLFGMFFGLLSTLRNKKSDDISEGQKDGVVLTELGYIKKGIEGIDCRLEKQEIQHIDVIKHLTRVEESTKQAHKRIDKLESFHHPSA